MSTQFRVSQATITGRTLTGIVITYGEISPEFREVVRAGAFGNLPDSMPVNVQHDPRLPASDRAILNDSPDALTLRAELLPPLPGRPMGGAEWLTRQGALTGLSMEFNTLESTMDGDGNNVVLRAELLGLGLVDSPAYPSSRIQLRQRQRLTTLRGVIPAGKVLDCRCGPGDCLSAVFEAGAMDSIIAPEHARDLLAVIGDYKGAVASTKRKSVRFWQDGEGGLQLAVDIPNSERGRDLLETMQSVDIFARPVIDTAASTFVMDGTTAVYSAVETRALTLGATDAAVGWVALREAIDDDLPIRAAEPPKKRPRRRILL